MGWAILDTEPSAYYISEGRHWERLQRTRDDLSLQSSRHDYLNKVRAPLETVGSHQAATDSQLLNETLWNAHHTT
jgi:hypothetical protein